MLSLSLWQGPPLETAKSVKKKKTRKKIERMERAAATPCWHINKPSERCPELTDQDRSANASRSVGDLKFGEASFSLCVTVGPRCRLPCSIYWKKKEARTEVEKKSGLAEYYPRITGHDFTFQSLIVERLKGGCSCKVPGSSPFQRVKTEKQEAQFLFDV